MGTKRMRTLMIALTALVISLGAAGTASAVNTPNWVAVLYVEAQKMVGLRWTPVPGATAYKVLRTATQGKDFKEIASVPTPQYFDKDLEPGTTYYYSLQAVAGAEVSTNAAEKSISIPGEKKQEAVTSPEWENITVQSQSEFGKTNFKVGLFWKATKGSVAAYNIYRSEAAGKDYALIGSVPKETQYVDAQLEEGKTYYYVLTALDATTLMETPYSAEKSVKLEAKVRVAQKKKEKIIQHFRVSSEVLMVGKGDWGYLSGPSDVDISDREIFVSNFQDKNIYVFDIRTGEFLRKFGAVSADLPQGLTDPKGLFYEPNDERLYVGDARSSRVLVFDPDEGKFLSDFKVLPEHGVVYPGEDYQKVAKIPPAPTDIALHPDGEALVVVDNGRSKVLVYDLKGKFVKEISRGVGRGEPGTFSFPTRAKFNRNKERKNDLLVVDGFGTRVQIYDFDKETWREFGELGEVAGSFKTPLDVDVDEMTNTIYVADKDNFNVTEFDYEGKYLNLLGAKTKNEDTKNYLLSLGTPVGLRIDAAKKLAYVADYYGSKIHVIKMTDEIFTPEGQ